MTAKRSLKVLEDVASSWDIDEIVEGPTIKKFNGKPKRCYKVKWSESYEVESNIPPALIENFQKKGKRVVRVLGPVINVDALKSHANDRKSSHADDQKLLPGTSSIDEAENTKPTYYEISDFKPQKTKFAVDIGGNVKLVEYKEVRRMFKDELLTYYEERSRVFPVQEK